MTDHNKPAPRLDHIRAWLEQRHGAAITGLEALSGGFWSSAYAYRAGADELVLRLGNAPDGFASDQAAFAFANAHLPIPQVLETGTALELYYAISRRHFGQFLENVGIDQADAAGVTLAQLLAALRAVPGCADDPVMWSEPSPAPDTTWRSRLLDSLADDYGKTVSGWRANLAADPRLDTLYRTCEQHIQRLLDACPERRDLVHGDLLHQNVLLAEDASRVTGIFSWKCSTRGDFLYDVAWCTFWDTWHPGIQATNIWSRTLGAPDLGSDDLVDAATRHHCYELQIAATHLAWCAWTRNVEELAAVAARTDQVLQRGPLPVPA